MKNTYHLAQINIAPMRAPLTDPVMAGFVAQIDAINALAEESSGFIWRFMTEEGDATAVRVFSDPSIIINMSVWESVEALKAYTYKSDHVKVLRDRKKWFTRMETPHMVLWWIPAGTVPTPEEGKRRLALLHEIGPSPDAFTFRSVFAAPIDQQGSAVSNP